MHGVREVFLNFVLIGVHGVERENEGRSLYINSTSRLFCAKLLVFTMTVTIGPTETNPKNCISSNKWNE